MKKTLATLLFIIVTTSLFGQYVPEKSRVLDDRFEFDWGEEFKDKNKTTASQFIGVKEEYTFVHKYSRKYEYIDKLDEDMNLVASVQLDLIYKKNQLSLEEIVFFGERIFVLSSYKNKKTETKYLFYQEFDMDDMVLTGDLFKIAEINYKNGNNRNSGRFFVELSRDKSKLLVHYDVPGKKDDREHFGFHVFDKEFGKMWEKEIVMPYREGLFYPVSYELDNNGEVYILGKLYKEKLKESKRGKVNYEMRMLAFEDGKEEPNVFEIAMKDVFLNEMSVLFKDDEIMCVGFYSKSPGTSADGCFAMSIDKKTKKIKNSNLEEFEMDFLTMSMSVKEKKKANKKAKKGKDLELLGLEIRNIVVKEDGSLILIAEQYHYYTTTHTTTGANGTTSTTTTHHYVYNDIILIGISESEKIAWYDKISKSQHTTNDGGFYSGFYFVSTKDRMYFVFNDNIKNSKILEGAKEYAFTKNKKTSVAVVVSVDYKGNKGKERLFSVKNESILIRPKVCGKTPDNEVLVFAQLKKTQRYGKVKRKG